MLIYSYSTIGGLIVEIKTNIKIDIQKLIYINWNGFLFLSRFI